MKIPIPEALWRASPHDVEVYSLRLADGRRIDGVFVDADGCIYAEIVGGQCGVIYEGFEFGAQDIVAIRPVYESFWKRWRTPWVGAAAEKK